MVPPRLPCLGDRVSVVAWPVMWGCFACSCECVWELAACFHGQLCCNGEHRSLLAYETC